jgi:hypothetical protein
MDLVGADGNAHALVLPFDLLASLLMTLPRILQTALDARLFVERKIYDEFVGRVAAFNNTLRVGDGSDPETQVGPLVS